MASFSIIGNRKLTGEIEVLGSKNSALPILAATLLSPKKCEIDNLPLIEDVFILIDILRDMGAEISWTDKRRLKILTDKVDPLKINLEKVKKLRGSILILGPLLARFGKVEMSYPGGCYIGARPLTSHFDGFKSLGAKIEERKEKYSITIKHFKGGEITLPEFSVTATENLVIFASLFPYQTIIKMAAAEPSIIELCQFLKKLGVKIDGEGTHTIIIRGKKKLTGASHVIWPDPIEAGTFIALGCLKNSIKILNVPINFLDMPFQRLKEMGVELIIKNRQKLSNNYLIAQVKVIGPLTLKGIKIQTLPYPGFPTDLQPIFCALATQAQGTSLIQEYLYEGRFTYIEELKKMGGNASILDIHRVIINGPTPLHGKDIVTHDLRSDITLIIAALNAHGKSVLNETSAIDRGYEKIEERFQKIGAEIKRLASYQP